MTCVYHTRVNSMCRARIPLAWEALEEGMRQ